MEFADTSDPTRRFSNRVANYAAARPGYPDEIVAVLAERGMLPPEGTIADIGSGTGISSELFLRHGFSVIGVEPNREMREAAESSLGGYGSAFQSVDGRAEATGLPDGSVDGIVAGQAFHWFEPQGTRREFARIATPGSPLMLIWNTRRTDGTRFLEEYERLLLRHGTDYATVRHTRIDSAALVPMFEAGSFSRFTLPNEQKLDLAGLRARLLSSSYVPPLDDPRSAPMLEELAALFERHQRGGVVYILYDTEIHAGRVRF